MRQGLVMAIVIALISGIAAAQTSVERQRAMPYFKKAWEFMRAESWPEAAKAFQQAIDTDHEYEDAYYGLGLASMRMKKYGDAIPAYVKCRDLYRAQAGKQFTNSQDAQRHRQDRLVEIDEQIRLTQTGPQSLTSQDRVRQLQDQRRQIQDYISRGNNVTVDNSVPSFVYADLRQCRVRRARTLPCCICNGQWGDAVQRIQVPADRRRRRESGAPRRGHSYRAATSRARCTHPGRVDPCRLGGRQEAMTKSESAAKRKSSSDWSSTSLPDPFLLGNPVELALHCLRQTDRDGIPHRCKRFYYTIVRRRKRLGHQLK